MVQMHWLYALDSNANVAHGDSHHHEPLSPGFLLACSFWANILHHFFIYINMAV